MALSLVVSARRLMIVALPARLRLLLCCLRTENDMTADQAQGEVVPAPGDARLFIGGEYVASAGERFEVVSPVTGAVIGTVPVPGPDEINAAVAAARAAQRAWARVNVWERAKR